MEEDKIVVCDKCGEETENCLVGDETYDYCHDCGITSNN